MKCEEALHDPGVVTNLSVFGQSSASQGSNLKLLPYSVSEY